MMIDLALNAKMYYLKAVNAYEEADEIEQDKMIYKDIIKAQKKCIKQLEKLQNNEFNPWKIIQFLNHFFLILTTQVHKRKFG